MVILNKFILSAKKRCRMIIGFKCDSFWKSYFLEGCSQVKGIVICRK